MASPSTICTSCLRALRSGRIAARTTPPNLLRNTSRAYRTATTPQQSLYLDFLVPTALRRYPKSSSLLSQPPLPARTYATATSTQAQPTPDAPPPAPSNLTRAILHPRNDESGQPMLISLTPRASNRLSSIMTNDANPELALRVSIESGGCHGFQYLMNLVDLSKSPATEEDTVFEGAKGAKVVIDESSLELLKGSTVDYTMELIGSQFKVTGIPGATSSCGCGTSFDIKF